MTLRRAPGRGRRGRGTAYCLGSSPPGGAHWAPYFYTDQFDLGMEYVGHGSADDDVVIRGDLDSGEFIAFWLRDGAVSAAMLQQQAEDHEGDDPVEATSPRDLAPCPDDEIGGRGDKDGRAQHQPTPSPAGGESGLW